MGKFADFILNTKIIRKTSIKNNFFFNLKIKTRKNL